MTGDGGHGDQSARAFQRVRLALITALIGGVVIPAGVGLAAILGRGGDDTMWARLGSVGETFGAMNALLSALALAALVITYLTQSRNLRAQGAVFESAREALRRSADVDARRAHLELMRMAIHDADLAQVLPSHGGLNETTRRQYLFINLLLQNVWMHHTAGNTTEAEMANNIRHFMASPMVRQYWRDTDGIRHNIYVDGAREHSLAGVADAIWREYEGRLAYESDNSPPDAATSVTPQEDRLEPPSRSHG